MADLTAELDLEIQKFRKSIAEAKKLTGRMKTDMTKVGNGLGGALFGGLGNSLRAAFAQIQIGALRKIGEDAFVELRDGLKMAFDLGGRMSDVAQQIGTSAGNAMVLEEAFRQAGIQPEKMATSINKMQRAIVEAAERGGTLAEPFEALNLSPEALMQGDPAETFDRISQAIAAIENPTERAARAMQIFGRSGGEMVALFDDTEAMSKARSQLGGQADIMTEAAATFDRASDILNGLFKKIQGFFVGGGLPIADQLLPVLEQLDALDLAPVGQKFGEALGRAVGMVRAAFE
ncbi:MAG: hypothetical protein AAF236_00810, partial [Verrucomicrobiota bacterium]